MKIRRRNYLIDTHFQIEFVLKFCALVILGCVLFAVILYIFSKSTLTTSFENSRLVVKNTASYVLPILLYGGIIVTLVMAITTAIVVIIMTHRIVGPLYRFEKYLQKIGSGDFPQGLKIRKNDQFHNLAGVFSKMVQDLSMGLLKVTTASGRLDILIDQLSERTNGEILLKEDIKRLVSELRKDKQELKDALSYFRVEHKH